MRSKTDVEFALEVKIGLHDWRSAQICAANVGYFQIAATVLGNTILLGTQTYAQIMTLRGGGGSDAVRNRNVRAASKKLMEAYSVLAFKGPEYDFRAASKAQPFDELRACAVSCYHIFPLAESERCFGPEILYQCSCPMFWHYGKCKHVLGYAIYKKQITVPDIYAIEKIGVNRKAGRPSKAKGGDALRRV
jgi:hypothetical protein